MSGTDTNTGAGTDTTKDDAAKDTKSTDATDTNGGAGKGSDADKAHDSAEDTTGLKKALQATRKERDELAKQMRDAELAKLPELERAQTTARELTDTNAKLMQENMRMKVALDLGLTWTLAKRLTGDSEDEMRADGAELLKQFKGDDGKSTKDDPKNKVKTTNDAKKTGSTGGPGMNEILRALRKG